MPWQPEDWNEWPTERWVAGYAEPAHVRAASDIVARLPAGAEATVLQLLRGPTRPLPILAERFGRVVAIDISERGVERLEYDGRCQAMLALDAFDPRQADATLAWARASLIEGGVLVGSVLAVGGSPRPFPMTDDRDGAGFHEIGLQFRLRRAGFQGLRLRRLAADGDEPERIVFMAARRALN